MNSSGFLQSFNYLSSNCIYVLNKLFLNPLGGSKVILTPFYSTIVGNDFDGIDVNHNLKSLEP